MIRTVSLATLLVGAALPRLLSAQQDPRPKPLPEQKAEQERGDEAEQAGEAVRERLQYEYKSAGEWSVERDDHRELHLYGGFRLTAPPLGLVLRGQSALLLFDVEQSRLEATRQQQSGLPTRGIEPPDPRRRLSPEDVRERLERSLRAVGRTEPLPPGPEVDRFFDLFRFLYCEGGVVVVQKGVEVLRCERLWLSPIDDRVVVEQAELRYVTPTGRGSQTLVVRAPRLVKQGGRWVGHDVLLTTCTAAEPHVAAAVDEIEIIERDDEFEVVSRGQTLLAGGNSLLPLPDTRFFTKSQSQFPIRRASVGYSGLLGLQAEVVFGLPWNRTGGALHRLLTGRPESEFRGDWEFGVGFIEARGVPLEGALTYRAEGLYQGRTEAFFLDDDGTNIREITRDFGGNLIDNQSRGLIRTENRVRFGERTHLDLVAFHATDGAVYPEFFIGPYRTDEVPETSTYLHHADGNRLLTIGTRFNLADFSYRDDRALAERFVEELPVATYQWLAEPVGRTPWGTPIVLDFETEVGQRRSDYDDDATTRINDRTFRADQLVELSTPFHAYGASVRPFVSGRGTYYDRALDGDDEGRLAFEAGVQIGTRLSRTWSWFDDEGERQGVRHVIAPRLTYRNRFRVDDTADEFFAFDEFDRIDERELVRFEVRNLVQTMVETPLGKAPRDFVFLDLAQDVFPDAARDNGGDTLGLFFYDLLLRPRLDWLPFENFALAVYGDHDWNDGMRTFDSELQFGPLLGCDWVLEYREDALIEGAVGVSASTLLMDRWSVFAGSQRDLATDEWLTYAFGLTRNDHDWSIGLSAVYNPFSDETTFRIDFLPRIGGLNQPRRDRFAGVDPRQQSAFDY